MVYIPRDSASSSGSHAAWRSFIQWFTFRVTQLHLVVLMLRDAALSSGSHTAWLSFIQWFSYCVIQLHPVVFIPRDTVSYSGSHTAWCGFIQWFSYRVTQFHTVVLIPRDVASSSGSYTAWCRVMRWFSYRIHLTDNETFRSSENIPMECGNYSHRRGHPFGPFTRGRPLWSVKLSGEVHEITALAFAALKCSFDSTAYMHVTVHCALCASCDGKCWVKTWRFSVWVRLQPNITDVQW